MKRVSAVLVAVLVVTGCAGEEFLEQKNTLTHLIGAGAYIGSGLPLYDGSRWTINARVEGCKGNVLLGGERADQYTMPTQYEVIEVNGTPLGDITTGVDAKNLTAPELVAITSVAEELEC